MNIKIISVRLKFKLLKKLGLEHFKADLLGIIKSKPLLQYNGLHFFSPVGSHLDEKKRTTPVAGKEKSSAPRWTKKIKASRLSRVFWQSQWRTTQPSFM